jgi:hypothetical protein
MQPAAPAAPPQVAMPDAEKIVLLLRTTLLTLNDALQSGSFAVMRNIASPGFREANSAARLSAIFADLSQRGVDLSAAPIIVRQLTEARAINAQTGMLRLKGYFPGQSVRIDFEILYQAVQGRWRMLGLSVQPTAVAAGSGTGSATSLSPAPPVAKTEPAKK